MNNQKKIFIIGGIVEAAILVFDLVVSILVWTTFQSPELYPTNWEQKNIEVNGPMIGFFQNNPTAFFCIICIPLFAIIALDFVYFAIVVNKKESKLSDAQLSAIQKKAQAQAEAEVLKELEDEMAAEEKPEEKKEEPKAEAPEEPKAE